MDNPLLIPLLALLFSGLAVLFHWTRLRRTTMPKLQMDVFEAFVNYVDHEPDGKIERTTFSDLELGSASGNSGEAQLIIQLTNVGLVPVTVEDIGLKKLDGSLWKARKHALIPSTTPMVLKAGEQVQVSFSLIYFHYLGEESMFEHALAYTSYKTLTCRNATVQKWATLARNLNQKAKDNRKLLNHLRIWSEADAPDDLNLLCKECFELLNSDSTRAAIDCFNQAIRIANQQKNDEVAKRAEKGLLDAIKQAEAN